MKLSFRDLKQQKFTIDAEPSETIGQLKEKIAQEKGWDAAQQKLIYSGELHFERHLRLARDLNLLSDVRPSTGKILQNANTIESYNIEEKGFVVCMVSKPKTQPAPSTPAGPSQPPATPAPAQTSTPAAPSAPAPATNDPSAPPATPSPAGGDAAAFNNPSTLLMGSQSEAAVQEMEAMGFPRADIDRAMRAAFFHPDRAIEYLLNGIPDTPEQPAAREQPSAPAQSNVPVPPSNQPAANAEPDEPINLFEAAAQAAQGGGARGTRTAGASLGGAAGGEGLSNLDFLRNNPHFQQLRQLVQQQPGMLEPILQQLGAGNPQLAQLIGQNQEQFLQLLSEDIEDDTQLPPGTHTISVTEEERDAIERVSWASIR
ncbi:UV excision repair protein Rad23 [Uncinocarpus reesii 1704]|uniref:UV excision repair protein RAD23 n=1 Tax=Uncinocarpus reesii (strain UAMH 1704) TaxID=336963 RepID=C4JMX1_UNCRE|nr:UV excision repair protein Rad23 [Uncinocarpus reesii 1704]EEP79333.1 UV excision repair protein Rad23 [Uncinocarpus reesii 1704]